MLSCNNKKEGFDYLQNVIHIKGEPLQIEQMIGNPAFCITTINDTLLAYYDRYDGKLLSVFDLKNNHFVGRFVSEGQGPTESLPPLFLFSYPQKDKLFTLQRNVATVSILDAQDFQIQYNIKFASRPSEIQKTKDYYIGIGVFDKGRFGVYDTQGEFLYAGETYPFNGKSMESPKAFLTYYGPFCANPDKNYFVAGCSFSDYIAFYEVTENKVIPIKEYYSYDAPVDTRNDNNMIGYNCAFGTASYCYMLFSGKTLGENKRQKIGRYIIVFDWQGNYIKTFNSDYDIFNFCVDEKNNCIYAVVREENSEYEIFKFKM